MKTSTRDERPTPAAGSWAGRARSARSRASAQDATLLRSLRTPATWPRAAVGWLTEREHATYSFAALRITLGLVMIGVLVTSFADRHYLWGVGSRFVDPLVRLRDWPDLFGKLFSKTDATLFDLAYLVLAALAVLFTLGLRTRIVTPFLLLFWVGLSTNSTLLTNGGDVVMRLTLFFALFADLSRHFSLDAVRRRRGPARQPAASLAGIRALLARVPRFVPVLLHNTALVLSAYQIMLIYVNSAILKLMGEEWRDGSATYYSLMLDGYRPWPALNDLLVQMSLGVVLASFMAVAFQGLFPVLILWRPSRIVALVVITGMHLMIGLLLGLWPFSLAMIALDFLFVRDATWRQGMALASRVRSSAPGWIRERMRPVDERSSAAPGDGSGSGSAEPADERMTGAIAPEGEDAPGRVAADR
ncbi:HTTM domain-containing protein [Clavibacter sp. MX14-G9D]|uniref:HTTM domain-containing protein n=1 Tax=Clavibacter sp. MX14-G9D TaxID=3064656 RepID=UPI00293F43FE|nr:HTTM domain-containing protein [Clavibacter sp. MX14-G9D]